MAGQETTRLAMLYIFAMCGPYTWDEEMRSAQEVEIKKKKLTAKIGGAFSGHTQVV